MTIILHYGDSLKLNTGYSIVNRNILTYLSKQHNVHTIGWSHSEPTEKLGTSNLWLHPPLQQDLLSSQTVLRLTEQYKPNFLFTSNDWFVWKPILLTLKEKYPETKLVSYSIIDGPYCAKSYQEIISGIDIPVVATQYAYNQLKEIGITSKIIPHGVNTDVFKPLDKQSLKQKLGLHDKFVYLNVNRNLWRKNLPSLLKAFSIVKKRYPDSVLLLLMNPMDPGGSDLNAYSKLFDLGPYDILYHPSYVNHIENLSTSELVDIYNAADVFVTSSFGEGFGLTTVEAMACGLPVIAPDNSSFSELLDGHGFLFDNTHYKNGENVLVHTSFKDTSYFLEIPDTIDLAEKMIEARENETERIEYGIRGREFVKRFEWSKVLPLWDEVFK